MKKFLFICLFFVSTFAFGQSLRLMHEGKMLDNGDTLTISTTQWTSDNIVEFDVVNVSESALTVWAARENISIVPGSENFFCYELCFDSSADTSAYGITIDPEDTLKESFSAHYAAHGNAGASLIKYSVFVEENLSDMAFVYVRYDAAVGMKNNTMTHVSLNAYPNPASDNVTIAYQLPQDNMAPSYLVVKNLIGKTVMSEPMSPSSDRMMLNVSDLTAGVYFYSIEQNNRALVTKKLIVK